MPSFVENIRCDEEFGIDEKCLSTRQFLTTYIISLMRSIDIRSEPAVRLLSDFLDIRGSEGRERQGTEHFVHG